MSEHTSQSDLEAYVMGSLEDVAVEQLERHVAGCPSCSAALEREAQLEELLHAAARSPSRPAREQRVSPARSRRRLLPLLVPVAAAAAWLWWWTAPPKEVAERLDAQLSEVLPPVAICDRRPDLCDEPAAHGILLPEMGHAAAPRYEEMGPARITWRDEDEPKAKERR